MVSECFVGVWNGLDSMTFACLIFSQACPVLRDGCLIMIHSLANNIKSSYFVLICQYDMVQLPATKQVVVIGTFYLSTCQSTYFLTLT